MKISIVSPVYKAEKIVSDLICQISEALQSLTHDYEILLVEDGSPDLSWQQIKIAAMQDQHVKGIKLSRNFGQHVAISAGLQHANGDFVVVMDCDLQDNPHEIPSLFHEINKGFDYVVAKRHQKKHTFLQRLSSRVFYAVFSYLTGSAQDSSIGNFGIYSRKVIDAVLEMNDQFKYFPAQVQWVGFERGVLLVKHMSRHSGNSTYNLRRLIALALNNMLSFSDKPLRLSVAYGLFVSFFSFMLGAAYIILAILGLITVSGFVSVIVSIFFTSGSIIIVIGMVGLYVGKTFEVAKNRPLYVIDSIVACS